MLLPRAGSKPDADSHWGSTKMSTFDHSRTDRAATFIVRCAARVLMCAPAIHVVRSCSAALHSISASAFTVRMIRPGACGCWALRSECCRGAHRGLVDARQRHFFVAHARSSVMMSVVSGRRSMCSDQCVALSPQISVNRRSRPQPQR
jgi:hypothetical protein